MKKTIRSLLFLPGSNPNMLINANILGADAVILDLEDAVSPDEKDSARILVRNLLGMMDFDDVDVIVRINPLETEYWKEDLQEVLKMKPDAIMPTKVSCAQDIHVLNAYMDELEQFFDMEPGSVSIIPLVETALGMENSFDIATASPRVAGMLLGAEDLTADLRCIRTKESNEIQYARSRIVMAARAAGIEVYDTPFTDVNDIDGLIADTETAKSLGFSGKSSISPRHLKDINRIFSPSEAEVRYAHQVLQAIETARQQGKGAVALFGKMIDKPIVDRAKRVLAMYEAIGGDIL